MRGRGEDFFFLKEAQQETNGQAKGAMIQCNALTNRLWAVVRTAARSLASKPHQQIQQKDYMGYYEQERVQRDNRREITNVMMGSLYVVFKQG